MNNANSPELDWQQLDAAVQPMLELRRMVAGDPAGATAVIGRALRDAVLRRNALRVLLNVDPGLTLGLIEEVVHASTSHKDALLAREALARLPHETARRLVIPVIVPLAHEADAEDLRRYAELLEHLGMYDTLRDLAATALRRDDIDMREIGEDYRDVGRPSSLGEGIG